MRAALLCWEKALALDPASAALNGMLSSVHCLNARFGWWDDRETALATARKYADRALELDPENADALTTSSIALMMKGRHDKSWPTREERSSSRPARPTPRASPVLCLRPQDTQKRRLKRARERWLSIRIILLITWAI